MQMVSVNPEDIPDVLASVTRWSIQDRIRLASQILQTVDDEATVSRTPVGKRSTADEVAAMIGFTGTAPTDEECDQIIHEHRMQHH